MRMPWRSIAGVWGRRILCAAQDDLQEFLRGHVELSDREGCRLLTARRMTRRGALGPGVFAAVMDPGLDVVGG